MIAMLASGTMRFVDTKAGAGKNMCEVVTWNRWGWSAWAEKYATVVV
jgi:hypothetical protein